MSVSDAINCDYLPINRWYPAFVGWCRLVAAVIALTMLFVAVPDDDLAGVVRLERLAPKIEYAPDLSPHAKQAIRRLMAQQREFVGLNPAYETRRKAAIERVAAALKAKEGVLPHIGLLTSNLKHAGD